MKTPSVDFLVKAAEWLDCYEPTSDEDDPNACKDVANWLRYQASMKDTRQSAKKLRLPVKLLRKHVEG